MRRIYPIGQNTEGGDSLGEPESGPRKRAGGVLRPILIVSHDVFNERSGLVIAVAITSPAPACGFSTDPGIEFEGFAETLVGHDQPGQRAGCGANREEVGVRHP